MEQYNSTNQKVSWQDTAMINVRVVVSMGALWLWLCGSPEYFTDIKLLALPVLAPAAVGIETFSLKAKIEIWIVLAGVGYFFPVFQYIWK